MRTMLRRWLGIEDAVRVIDALDERYQYLEKFANRQSAINGTTIQTNDLVIKKMQRVDEIDSALSRKLSKDEFEGVNEEFRQLEDEFDDFKYEIELLADVMSFGILTHASKLRFLSRFIGATNKKGGGDAKE